VRVVEVEPGWEDSWRSFHQGVRIGPLWVGPPWEEPPLDALAVVIDPGGAFGTGAHPTTRLCRELLLELPLGSLLDVGCGSGVLAIAAARLGFKPVVAVDAAEPAVEATRANAAANGVSLDTRCLDTLTDNIPPADVALANIAFAAVEALPGRLETNHLVTSGYLAPETPALAGFRRLGRRELDGWAGDLYVRA
jgi:ribosomal protein L11 methyltransferase